MTVTRDDRAELIVKAAYRCLADQSGDAKISLDRVAATAGVHRATIYRYFPGGRDELLVAVYAQASARFLKQLGRHLAYQPTLAEKMVEGLVYTVEQTFGNAVIAPMFAPAEAGRLTALGPTSRVLNDLVREFWGPLLQEAKGRGEARSDLSLDTFTEFMMRFVFSLLSDWAPEVRGRDVTKDFLRQVVTPFVTANAAPVSTTPIPKGPVLEVRAADRPARSGGGAVADRLVEQAATLFREKGFERSSTRELAERLEISQPSLYHHVGSKQELLERVCIAGIERLVQALRAAVPGARSPLTALIGTHLEVLTRTRDLQLARLFEQDALDEDAYARVREHRDAYAALVSSLLRAEQEAGRLRADLTSDQLTLALVSLVSWSLFWLPADDADALVDAEHVLTTVFVSGAGREGHR